MSGHFSAGSLGSAKLFTVRQALGFGFLIEKTVQVH